MKDTYNLTTYFKKVSCTTFSKLKVTLFYAYLVSMHFFLIVALPILSYFQAPFYPHEAEKKGCVPSEYGLVFGIFELTVFLVSPIIGANMNRMGMKFTLNFGIGTVGVTSILFGLLDRIGK